MVLRDSTALVWQSKDVENDIVKVMANNCIEERKQMQDRTVLKKC